MMHIMESLLISYMKASLISVEYRRVSIGGGR